jgi:hypothetical protein
MYIIKEYKWNVDGKEWMYRGRKRRTILCLARGLGRVIK